jgi:hypothetical protein
VQQQHRQQRALPGASHRHDAVEDEDLEWPEEAEFDACARVQ